ncbi:hypothetical protein DFH11DRAFT_1622854 [Phellopilus nigrolimitatus]|nr:hypothetical protein DFH11DRAFT_1622854 [Phellopilus nigrolimitatus]
MNAQQPNEQTVSQLASIASHLMAAKMFSLACCVMLFYDISITFGDEVEKIWKQRFTFASVLWFMNRYLSPLGYIVVIVSFNDPNWSKSVCNRYVLYPEVLKIFTSAAIGVIFILRLYSLYGGSMAVLGLIAVLLLAELAVKIWAFTDGTSVSLPPGLVGCILTGKSNSNDRFVYTWVAELIFDTAVFLATLFRTLLIYRKHRHGAAIPLIKMMMRDGILYFLIIFAANVVTVTLFLVLPADLKAINASFSTLITSLMVSRLILNLRNQASRPNAVSFPSSNHAQERAHITSTIIGNLGEPVTADWFDEDDKNASSDDAFATGGSYQLSETGEQRRAASTPPQIIVEVTKSVTTDVPTLTVPTRADHRGLGLGNEILSDFSTRRVPDRPRSWLHGAEDRRSREGRIYRVGAWQPPLAWAVDSVDAYELETPRRHRTKRRPGTS